MSELQLTKNAAKANLTNNDREILVALAGLGQDEHEYYNQKQLASLLLLSYVEINAKDSQKGKGVATRITEEGLKYLMENAPTVAPPVEPKAEAPKFELEKGIEVPKRSAPTARSSKYPFSKMEVGTSFHLPSKDEKGRDSMRTVSSSVSSWNAANAVPDPDGATRVNKSGKTVPKTVPVKQLVIRRVDGSDPKGEGVRVFRIK